MLRPAKTLENYILGAPDGVVGRLKDFHFDDRRWIVRYLAVETDSWLKSELLLRPLVDAGPHAGRLHEPLDSTVKQVRSNLLSSTKPSLRYEERPVVGANGDAAANFHFEYAHGPHESQDDPALRSMRVVTGYSVEAVDGTVGRMGDFIIEDTGWSIQYLVVDVQNWIRAKRILIAPEWIGGISGLQSRVFVDLDRTSIEGAPEYDSSLLQQPKYLARLQAYYDRQLLHYSGHQGFL